jgi:uncharacterized protein (DUF4415 family)
MEREGSIIRASAEEIRRMLETGGDRTDWARVRAMPQEEVERLADEEEGPLPEGWEKTAIVYGGVGIEADLLCWFRQHGPDPQAHINRVLRDYVETRRRAEEQAAGAASGSD